MNPEFGGESVLLCSCGFKCSSPNFPFVFPALTAERNKIDSCWSLSSVSLICWTEVVMVRYAWEEFGDSSVEKMRTVEMQKTFSLS